MTREEKTALILENANKNLDLPVLGEETEAWLLAKFKPLLNALPERVLDIVLSASDGLTEEEIATLKTEAVDLANKSIDIKFVPEDAERLVFSQAIDMLFNAAQQGVSIVQK